MKLKEHNWKILTEQHLYDWHGIWTRYSSTGEVQESFKSLRSFRSNPEKIEIFHTNRYFYDDGRTEEKKWNYKQEEFSQVNNSISFFFEQGSMGWLAKALVTNSMFVMELLFKYEHLRHSIIMMYDQQGNLLQISSIKEDSQGFPSSHWSTEIEQLSSKNFPKNWQGTSLVLNSDLEISEPVSSQFSWDRKGHKIFYLPDGVSISCPDKVTVGTAFDCVTNWLIDETQMQQLIASYDTTGKFQSLTLEKYELKS
ncbi:MAG: DUF3598 family protein [Crocosphaera sp.]|nr:DUF3598 family protein [Crocosphaera sp.]